MPGLSRSSVMHPPLARHPWQPSYLFTRGRGREVLRSSVAKCLRVSLGSTKKLVRVGQCAGDGLSRAHEAILRQAGFRIRTQRGLPRRAVRRPTRSPARDLATATGKGARRRVRDRVPHAASWVGGDGTGPERGDAGGCPQARALGRVRARRRLSNALWGPLLRKDLLFLLLRPAPARRSGALPGRG